jgi:hypothetical protein
MNLILANAGLIIFYLVVIVVYFASWWKLFEKANKPGWMGIVPILNIIVLCGIVGRPAWWVVLFLIPCVNIVFIILLWIDVAKSFGKDPVYAVGLILLGIVFFPLLAFGDSKYVGPSVNPPAPPII